MFSVSILDIERAEPILKELVHCVVLPGEEGEFSILDFHQPIISCLKKGVIQVDTGKAIRIKIRGGIAAMNGDELTVLVNLVPKREKDAKI